MATTEHTAASHTKAAPKAAPASRAEGISANRELMLFDAVAQMEAMLTLLRSEALKDDGRYEGDFKPNLLSLITRMDQLNIATLTIVGRDDIAKDEDLSEIVYGFDRFTSGETHHSDTPPQGNDPLTDFGGHSSHLAESSSRYDHDEVLDIAESAFNLAAMLSCAQGLAKHMEDDSRDIDPQVHALQRSLSLCVDAAHEIGSKVSDLPSAKGRSH